MRTPVAATALLLLAGCAQFIPPAEVPTAPVAQAPLVVTDIDGTLTPSVWATNEARPGAAEVLQAHAARGDRIVYVSTRVPWLQPQLPLWLAEHGFPPGVLHVAQNAAERDGPRAFKAGILKAYVAKGWQLQYGYGDSSTDFEAYQDAGLSKERVFALQRAGASRCQDGSFALCVKGWKDLPAQPAQ